MTNKKWFRVDFYVGLLDSSDFVQYKTIKEAVDEVVDIIEDCTIIPCIGSFKHSSGVRINMNTLKITKFSDRNPDEFVEEYKNKLKELFNQESVIVEVSNCVCLKFI